MTKKEKEIKERQGLIEPISPPETEIKGVIVEKRSIFNDPRGALIETFSYQREEDPSVYAYWSVTRPGEARDMDRFHFHRRQKDRFTVVRGEMWILLLDMREDSSTYGKLEILEMKGTDLRIREKCQVPTYTVAIPEGVYHAIMAPGPGEAELVNHPTQPYDPSDEGRVPFEEVEIPEFGKFSWDLVKKLLEK